MDSDTLLTSEELQQLEQAKTEEEWNSLCDAVKRARGRMYPRDWFQKVIATGLIARKVAEFRSGGK